MNPEERVNLVIDLAAEEILRQMREAAAEKDEKNQPMARPASTSSSKNKQKTEVSYARERI